jgi:hypothetical protein
MSGLFQSNREFKTRRQFLQWGLLLGGISTIALKLNPREAQAANPVKIPPIPVIDSILDLSSRKKTDVQSENLKYLLTVLLYSLIVLLLM